MSAPSADVTAIERLREVDPDCYDRMVATASAVLAGGPVPCPACDVVAIDAEAWTTHAHRDHLGGAA